MDTRRPPPATLSRRLVLALAPAVWLVAVPAAHAGVPWALSHLGPRYGWAPDRPAGWNLLGCVPVAAGAALLAWVMVFGFARARDLPERVPIDWSPALLLTGGPYTFTRNPMYVGELALWLGWAVLYGSLPVLIGLAGLTAVVVHLARREEQALEAKFGEAYGRYKARVPRWIGRRHLSLLTMLLLFGCDSIQTRRVLVLDSTSKTPVAGVRVYQKPTRGPESLFDPWSRLRPLPPPAEGVSDASGRLDLRVPRDHTWFLFGAGSDDYEYDWSAAEPTTRPADVDIVYQVRRRQTRKSGGETHP